jgi:quercetin dioxygenase-like cupin family protein
MKRHHVLLGWVLCCLLFAAPSMADDHAKVADAAKAGAVSEQAARTHPEHRAILPGEFQWVDAPPSLPKGAKVAVIHGDFTAPQIFAMRLSVPAGYKIPPHWHPADEHVTVISGEFYMGTGEAWDESKARALPAGSVGIMPAGMRHFAFTKVETVLQLHAMGPWGINYVNPQDDPRNQKQATK